MKDLFHKSLSRLMFAWKPSHHGRSRQYHHHGGGSSSPLNSLLVHCFPEHVSRQLLNVYRNIILPFWLLVNGALPALLKDLALVALVGLTWAPGAFRMHWYYWVASDRKTFRYGNDSIRQKVDVFPSRQTQEGAEKSPTVLFCCGGAWIIAMNPFGAFMARTLTEAGITVVIADYRNYPQATVPSQVDDVDAAIQWTRHNVGRFGGDADNLVVVGESAGGHLLLMAMLRRALQATTGCNASAETTNNRIDWQLSDVKGFVGMAVPANFSSLEATLEKHKWDRTVLQAIFGGQFDECDPYSVLLQRRENDKQNFASQPLSLPPMRMFHGTHDQTIPLAGVQVFCNELKEHGALVDLYSIPGFSHTDANMQGPFRGDYRFQRHVFSAVQEWCVKDDKDSRTDLEFPCQDSVLLRRMCPEPLVRLGTELSPF